MEMIKVPLLSPALDARSQILSIKDRRNGVGKSVFNLAPFGSGQLFALVALDLCVTCIPGEVLQRVAPFSAVSRFDGFYTFFSL